MEEERDSVESKSEQEKYFTIEVYDKKGNYEGRIFAGGDLVKNFDPEAQDAHFSKKEAEALTEKNDMVRNWKEMGYRVDVVEHGDK